MNFSEILNLANNNTNNNNKKDGHFYKSKFTAPKKESKEKRLSANIQRFLQKKQAEQLQKIKAEAEKKNTLIAMRDTKQKNKIKKMLKVIKSADKSVIEDAKDVNDTAITLQGPDQPDEDDYGYESVEAKAFYAKLMEKYKKNSCSLEKISSTCNDSKKFGSSMEETLERTKIELRTTRFSKTDGSVVKSKTETITNNLNESVNSKKNPSLKKAPKPLAFNDLLKLAEQKQYEPIQIQIPATSKQEERLMSKKEKIEFEEKLRYLKKRKFEAKHEIGKTLPKTKSKDDVVKQIIVSSKVKPHLVQKNNEKSNTKFLNKNTTKISMSSISSSVLKNQTKTNLGKVIPKEVQLSKVMKKKYQHKNLDQKSKNNKNNNKLKIKDYDSEENESDMDSFIDDDGAEDVSSYIQEIFGYDKSKYRDDESDDEKMESNFAQQMKEESISKKIGILEDLEDMRQEELAKKKKLAEKKKKKRI
uniref:Protein SPT2 homolog n=1 Tax=Culicoides sonorensis TaxID=179676 RepID=A0A336L6E2_CULSO